MLRAPPSERFTLFEKGCSLGCAYAVRQTHRPRPSRKVAPEGRVSPLPLEPAPALLITGRAAFYIAPGAAFVLLHSKYPGRTLPELATWRPHGRCGAP